MKHTKEPWSIRLVEGHCYISQLESAEAVAEVFNLSEDGDVHPNWYPNAQRIRAAVNACKGISTDRLEKMVPGTLANLLTLKGEE